MVIHAVDTVQIEPTELFIFAQDTNALVVRHPKFIVLRVQAKKFTSIEDV